jgi:surfactin synthase thioesterase subunit/glycosyltransferase involved in cell wall biosynthesis
MPPSRILLAATASYAPPRGGATRSNLLWLRHLAAAGHHCRIVCGPSGDGADLPAGPNIEILPIADPAARVRLLTTQIQTWNPDHVLVSSEDLSHSLLREAHHRAPGRVVYLAHTPQFFPFGPESWNPDPAAALVLESAGIVAIGRHMAGYIRRELGRDAAIIHPPIYGPGPFPLYENFNRGRIVMVNPCAVKGIGIFLEAAARMPRWEFAAVPGWGTTSEDRRALERLPNVRLLPNAASIDEILAETRILMMPSLWYEGFGLIVMEAMLRGIPVVSSDSGGLNEAKAGTGYVIPVRTIERYQPAFDQHAMPKPVLPEGNVETNIAPWIAALLDLLTNRDAYQREAAASRQAAHHFVQGLDSAAFETYLASLRPRLKILLAQNAVYYPAHGGGEKSNRLLMEALAARGHQCRVVARVAAREAVRDVAQAPDAFDHNGVNVRTAPDNRLRATFAAEAAAFHPDVILASTDDPAQILLEPALQTGARVVYLVRATLAVPFGPDSAFPSEAQTARVRSADAVVGVSQYVADYVRQYAGIPAVHVPISLLERNGEVDDAWPDLGRFENEFVTIVNPCAVKGIAIFLALADAFPEVPFAAVPTWGTDDADRAALSARANITVLNPVDDIDLLLARTRVLLVPSLWAEARSRIVLEAMLGGIPVIAANTGGLPEAKMGVPYMLPVNPIVNYQPRLNQQMVPIADVPPQDIAPWQDALNRLLTDRDHYQQIAHQSRAAAQNYAANLSVAPFEHLLVGQASLPVHRPATSPNQPLADARGSEQSHDREGVIFRNCTILPGRPTIELSPEKRQLLALRLRKRAPAASWFPGIDAAPSPRLFWFPHAGAGQSAKPPSSHTQANTPANICPVVYPGRESRLAEAPFERMRPLVEALAQAIEHYLIQPNPIEPSMAEPFAFFGHSMGAIVAFELARELRRRSLPLPFLLIASAARAPQFRRDHVPPPEPSDEALLLQAELPDHPSIRHAILPALRADTKLYRHYSYAEDAPLPFPIRAYGGTEDPTISREHLEAWQQQTAASFAIRLFPGGHFYLRTAEPEFLTALHEDLHENYRS